MEAHVPATVTRGVNIASAAFKANPFPFYARLRNEAPVCRVALPGGGLAWLVTRYADVTAALRDERFVKNRLNAFTAEQRARQPWMPRAFEPLARNMLDLDPPDHTRLRALVQKAFTPRGMEAMRDRIQRLADGLLDAALASRRFDLLRDYALPIPATIIAEMLGVPVKDRHRFHKWSTTAVSINPSGAGIIRALPHVLAFLRYIRNLIRARKASAQEDLVTALVQAEESGGRLTEDETLAMVFLLLIAGHETTVNLIGNGTLALLQHPEELQRLQDDPRLIKSAVEELLRHSGPLAMSTERFAREDVEIGGAKIRRGEMVFMVLASANRDESAFPNADALDIAREPNRHVAFGQGIHFCLGASLARLEAEIALSALVERAPALRLAIAPGALRWTPGLILRGLKALPVTCHG